MNKSEKPTVIIIRQAWQQAIAYCEEARGRHKETMFYLLGPPRRDPNKRIITRVLRAGSPVETAVMTSPDLGASGQALAPLLKQDLVVHGEGHHHLDFIGPSGGDIHTLQTLDAELFPEYLCFVVTTFNDGQPPVARAVAIRNGAPVEFNVTLTESDGESQLEYQPFLPKETRKKSLAVFGLGSGGATVALQASKWGLQRLLLGDHDTFVEPNLQRHLADRTAIGQSKASWLKAHLEACNTSSEITVSLLKIAPSTLPEVERLVRVHDYIANGTGHPVASVLLSEACRKMGKPVVHAGVFSRGNGGFVFRQDADSSAPCYSCLFKLTKHAQPDDEESVEQLKKQYGFTDEELEGQLGLWTDANLTSSLQAKVLLDLIKNDTPSSANLFVWDNQTLKLTTATIAQDAECPTCRPPQHTVKPHLRCNLKPQEVNK